VTESGATQGPQAFPPPNDRPTAGWAGFPPPPPNAEQQPTSAPLAPPSLPPAPLADADTVVASTQQPLPTPTRPAVPAAASAEALAARQALKAVRTEVAKAVVGQAAAVTGMVIALLCQGHVLLEGVPGVAKTLLVRTLSAAVSLETKRVQFTPDLMPGDITGSLIYDARTAEFSFREGPVFTNLLLADEINRTPPKTQAALLEAMEEHQVSVDGEPRLLPTPFLVAATQNPLEFEGTYPLPEAQLDRFLLKIVLPLPSRDEEIAVLRRHAEGFDPRDLDAAGVKPVAGAEQLAVAREAVRQVAVAPEVLAYIADLVRATRASTAFDVGVSPRGATALLQASRAWAWLSSRDYLLPDDVKALAKPVLRHRVRLRPEMELEGVSADSVLDSILAAVVVPR
jgi:MoxR-like ATPase